MMPDGATKIPPLNIEVSTATGNAISSIKSQGGSVTCVHRTKLTLRYHIKPEKFNIPPNDPQPPPYRLLKLEALKEKG